jgi:hypothetical protein
MQVPYGFCQCGCGNKAPIAKYTCKRDGYVKGQPIKYIRNHRPNLEDRFWASVDVKGINDCWPWKSGKTVFGYGTLKRNMSDRPVAAHRVSWEIHNGVIPAGLYVLHKCDNPPCCNPNHLFLGTHEVNIRDMVNKRRHRGAKGFMNYNAKLTETDILAIRIDPRKTSHIALDYGVHKSTVLRIRQNLTWRHVHA